MIMQCMGWLTGFKCCYANIVYLPTGNWWNCEFVYAPTCGIGLATDIVIGNKQNPTLHPFYYLVYRYQGDVFTA